MKYWQKTLKVNQQLLFIGVACLLIFTKGNLQAQNFTFKEDQKRGYVDFEMIKNLIVIPLYINDKGPYHFILDTGVGSMIITDPELKDSLGLTDLRSIKIYGLGQGEEIEAYLSNSLNVRIQQASIQHIPATLLKEDVFNLSGYLGKKIYGLIGYSFFSSFIVKVSYADKRVTFALPSTKMGKRGAKFPLSIENFRPYLFAALQIAPKENVQVKLIVDCGASHSLAMSAYNGQAFPLPKTTIPANLGVGLSGPIDGSVGRIPMFRLGRFKFTNILSSFPSFESVGAQIGYKGRDGNLGAEFLRRFDITYDYQGSAIYFRPNSNYSNPFEHDMSGMEIYVYPDDNTRFFIGRIEPDSPAEKAGFLLDDEILSINLKSIESYTLDEITNLLKSNEGKTIVLEIMRDDKPIVKLFHLKRRI